MKEEKMKPILEVLAEARLGCTYLNDTVGGSERIKYARVDADHILKTLGDAGYVIVRDRTDPEGGIPGRQ